jgi:hypothetical protein
MNQHAIGTPAIPADGRYRADFPEGTVVFLIGMRINSLRRIREWWAPFMAMPKMIAELILGVDGRADAVRDRA